MNAARSSCESVSRQAAEPAEPLLLAALNRPTEFETHCRGALRNGVTVDELRETLTQIAVHAGVPAGMEAFRIARRVLAEHAPSS